MERIDRRNGMACCEHGESLAPPEEERIVVDDKGTGVQSDESGESCIDLSFSAGLQNVKLQRLRARRPLRLRDSALGIRRIVLVHEHSKHDDWGTNSDRSWKRLGVSSVRRMLKPVTLPPGRARLATEAPCDRVVAAAGPFAAAPICGQHRGPQFVDIWSP